MATALATPALPREPPAGATEDSLRVVGDPGALVLVFALVVGEQGSASVFKLARLARRRIETAPDRGVAGAAARSRPRCRRLSASEKNHFE
jgi:hypothetical protein